MSLLLLLDKRRRGGRTEKRGLLLKPTGNLLKALHKAYLHGDPSRLLNPSNLAVPLLLLKHHTLPFSFFGSALFS